MAPLDVWYDRVDVDAVLAVSTGRTRRRAEVDTCGTRRHHTSLAALPKLTELVDGRRRIIEDPPLILHAQHDFDVPRDVFDAYRASRSAGDRRPLLDRFRVVDVARKVVGVGSVGTRCSHRAVRWTATAGRPLFLQIKEAEVSVARAVRRGVAVPNTKASGSSPGSGSCRRPATSSSGGPTVRTATTTTCGSCAT